jgi:hypothetical protein
VEKNISTNIRLRQLADDGHAIVYQLLQRVQIFLAQVLKSVR